ncbi:MAG: RAP domain-containing protein, partial [Alphaproteobacteria bacterium]|nr:RAP domain-containing protein [Alphaproteobacteria bacterium]
IFYGHAQLGLKPNEAFYEAWKSAALSRLTSKNPKEQFNQQELANIFYGHAQLGLKPNEAFYEAWKSAALSRLTSKNPKEQFNQQELANIFYGHAQLGLKPNEAFYEAWKSAALPRLKSTDPKEQFSQKQLHSIYLTMKRFALEDLLRENLPRVPLIKTLKAKAPKRSKLQSDVSQSLQTYLKANNVSTLPQEEYWVEDVASYVDIFLALASQKVIIEVDGPSHFFPGTREYKPKNKLREEILNQTHMFTKLVRIPYYEWDELQTLESKSKYLEGKLSLSLGQTVQTDSSEIKEQETKSVKHGAKKSSLRADAPPFVPQANRLLPKKKLPLSSTSEWEENEQVLPFKS